MLGVLLAYVARHPIEPTASSLGSPWRNRREHWRLGLYARHLQLARIATILRRGTPAAVQILLEVGVFAAATLAAGKLGAVAVSGHQIALMMASLTFMVPLGIAQATSVRVGNAIGRRDAEAAQVSGWSGVALSAGFMGGSALVLWTFPWAIVHIFTRDPEIAAVGVSLLAIAAIFQFFDGVQVTAIGALRGSGNTRIAMLTDLAGFWVVGLPLGAWLCFARGWGVRGLWIGLSTGLISIGCVLAVAWSRRVRRLRRELGSAPARAMQQAGPPAQS
jgi:MATE family multidrug resistance protein